MKHISKCPHCSFHVEYLFFFTRGLGNDLTSLAQFLFVRFSLSLSAETFQLNQVGWGESVCTHAESCPDFSQTFPETIPVFSIRCALDLSCVEMQTFTSAFLYIILHSPFATSDSLTGEVPH